ncbi:MAG: hypothetical protein ABI042_10180 [Verrucomicrobiota bacterium]
MAELVERFGAIEKLGGSKSLFQIGKSRVRVYLRYSKVHPRGQTFYGLRADDLKQLEGYASVIVFLWDNQTAPLIVPFVDYESVFQTLRPARDGQFKAQVYPEEQGTELYIAKAGRFNVEGYFGWSILEDFVEQSGQEKIPDLSHSQVQTLIGAIGIAKGFDIWIPAVDRNKLDWLIAKQFACCDQLPFGFENIHHVLQEIDIVWVQKGSNQLTALFEVEHSTPIYSGLLRFNDIHLVSPNLSPRFSIVANNARRDVFVKQLNRPTFKASGLTEMCNFLEYPNVFSWHKRICK